MSLLERSPPGIELSFDFEQLHFTVDLFLLIIQFDVNQ